MAAGEGDLPPAVLPPSALPPSARALPGAAAVLAAQAAALPQPDHSCGPYAARAALHAVLPAADVPDLGTLAHACRTRCWPAHGVESRPPGEAAVPMPGEPLAQARRPSEDGTDAPGVRRGVATATRGDVAVVPAAPPPGVAPAAVAAAVLRLLGDLAGGGSGGRPGGGIRAGVVGHVRTGPLVAGTPAAGWDVGHFLCFVGLMPDPDGPGAVVLADSYPSLGEPGWPPGCRPVPAAALADAVLAPPGRGLLLLVPAADEAAAADGVRASGLVVEPWRT